jgi:hypothetical protein
MQTYLEKRQPAKNVARFYRMAVLPNLFGGFCRKVWRCIKKLVFCSPLDTFGRQVSENFLLCGRNFEFQRPKRRSAKNKILQEKTLRQYPSPARTPTLALTFTSKWRRNPVIIRGKTCSKVVRRSKPADLGYPAPGPGQAPFQSIDFGFFGGRRITTGLI